MTAAICHQPLKLSPWTRHIHHRQNATKPRRFHAPRPTVMRPEIHWKAFVVIPAEMDGEWMNVTVGHHPRLLRPSPKRKLSQRQGWAAAANISAQLVWMSHNVTVPIHHHLCSKQRTIKIPKYQIFTPNHTTLQFLRISHKSVVAAFSALGETPLVIVTTALWPHHHN